MATTTNKDIMTGARDITYDQCEALRHEPHCGPIQAFVI